MAKPILSSRRFVAYVKQATIKIKKLDKKKRVLLSILIFILVTVILSLIYISIGHKKDKNTVSCRELSSETEESIKKIGRKEDVDKAYQKLETNKRSCAEKNNLLGVGTQNTGEKLDQLQFYHQKATTGYMLGKREESKKDAEKGLEINKELGDSAKKLNNHDQVIKELEYVRDGTY